MEERNTPRTPTAPVARVTAVHPAASAPSRFYSRHDADYTDRLPGMAEAFGRLPTQSAILDGELVLIDPRGAAHFYRLMAGCGPAFADESQLMFLAFDLPHQDGVDLRGLTLSERKRDLHRQWRKSRVPFMRQVQTFPNAPLLVDHCNKFGFEGVGPSVWPRAIRVALAAIGSRRSARIENVSTSSDISCSRATQARADGSTENAREEA